MTKITLLGDSIRGQYAPVVTDLLGEDYEIFAPNENCRHAKHTLRGLFDWQSDMEGSRIVHWNNGLWDNCNLFGDGLFSSEEEYVENMLRIANILLQRHEIVIFATTTPVTAKNIYTKNEDIIRYNEILVPLLKEKGILINDLHAKIYPDIDRYICNDNIHLSDEGIVLCAQEVAKKIREATALLSSEAKSGEAIRASEKGAPVLI